MKKYRLTQKRRHVLEMVGIEIMRWLVMLSVVAALGLINGFIERL